MTSGERSAGVTRGSTGAAVVCSLLVCCFPLFDFEAPCPKIERGVPCTVRGAGRERVAIGFGFYLCMEQLGRGGICA